MRRIACLALVLVLSLAFSKNVYAQDGRVTGTIKAADDNSVLAGVTVSNQTTKAKTVTNGSGFFTIAAKQGEQLMFSFVGYADKTVTVGTSTVINLSLSPSNTNLGEVVVTAYNIRRDKKSLGYSTQVIGGDEVAQTRRENFFNSLAGRVAGATITSSSGAPGSSSQIILRGATSIGGNNQPLIVVDGVPYDNQSLNQETLIGGASVSFVNRNSDYGNRAMDINPSDIESVTILKGPEATALYGSDGAGGAILITTKRGKAGKTSITYDNSFRFEKVYRFPDIQKTYGLGRNGIYDPNAVANPFSIFLAGGGIPSAFGPKIPAGTATYDNPENFFKTGFTQQHNLSVEGGSELVNVRLAANYTNQEGVVPNTDYEKLNLRLSGTAKVLNKINLTTSLSYTNSITNKATKGAGGYLLNLLTWPVTSDIRNYISPNGTRLPIRNSVSSNFQLEYDNPLWDVTKNPSQDKLDRFNANMTISSDITKWLNVAAIIGIDYYTQTGTLGTHPQSRFGFASNGFYSLYEQTTRNINNIYKATLKKDFNKFTNSFTLGFAFDDNKTNVQSQKGENFYERDFMGINNTAPTSRDAKTTVSNVRKVRFFGNLITGYDNLVFLSLAGTREGVSTFGSKVIDKNLYFNYGAASLSFVFSDLKPIKENMKWLSFGKARLSYATTGKGPYAPYVIDYRFTSQISTGGGFAYDVTGNNFDLEPEKTRSLEYGLEAKFLKNRISVDIARYTLKSENQILPARASYGTGFVLKWFNGGLVENRGWEVQLGLIPVQNKNFTWETKFNYDRNRGQVKEMPSKLPTYYDSDTWVFGNLRSQYFVGAQIGNMASIRLRRNSKGQVLISPSTGLPLRDGDFTTVGDRTPDFKLGWINNFSYKNFDLSFNLDFRLGGDVFNATEYLLYLTGYSTKTLDRETPRVIEGVLLDGLENTANPTKNTIVITPQFNSDFYNTTTATEEDFVENVKWMRLRDITLSYRLPQSWLKKQNVVKSASVFFTGTDLFMITNYTGADPSVNANTASNRGYGGAGIDYGSISTPRGYNFGLRVSF